MKKIFSFATLAILVSSCELRREPAKIAPTTSPAVVEMTTEGTGSPIITGTGDGASTVNLSYGPEGTELNGHPIKEGHDTLFIWGPGDTTWVRWQN